MKYDGQEEASNNMPEEGSSSSLPEEVKVEDPIEDINPSGVFKGSIFDVPIRRSPTEENPSTVRSSRRNSLCRNGPEPGTRGAGVQVVEGPIYYRLNDDNSGPELLVEVRSEV